MEGLLIALLIAAVSGIFSNKNKANQRKKPLNAKTANKREDNNYIYSSQKNNAKPKQKPNANYSMSYVSTEPVTEKIQHSNIIYEEDIDNEETLDIGLSDMQKAVVMAEILDKPLALRKK